ncbi:MAG: hypothetical protein QOJ69_514, partial [Actinomycetota bacterium]|nr:hypothetical protein [Actinomycetota bacterium]
LPLLTPDDLGHLLTALAVDPRADAAAAADHRGRPHPLLAAYRVAALRATVASLGGSGRGQAAARLLPGRVALVDLGPAATLNVNTPADLDRARSVTAQGADRSGSRSP